MNEIRTKIGGKSLIPEGKSYKTQLANYVFHVRNAGFSKMHGLRHAYAQNRYEDLTGWKSPSAGGVTSKMMTASQKEKDLEARLIISRELGHEREQITAVYLGR